MRVTLSRYERHYAYDCLGFEDNQGSGIWVLHKDWRQLLLCYERSVVKEVCRKRQATDKKVVCRDRSTNNFLSVTCSKSLAGLAILPNELCRCSDFWSMNIYPRSRHERGVDTHWIPQAKSLLLLRRKPGILLALAYHHPVDRSIISLHRPFSSARANPPPKNSRSTYAAVLTTRATSGGSQTKSFHIAILNVIISLGDWIPTGFDLAQRHEHCVKGLAFIEFIKSVESWAAWPEESGRWVPGGLKRETWDARSSSRRMLCWKLAAVFDSVVVDNRGDGTVSHSFIGLGKES